MGKAARIKRERKNGISPMVKDSSKAGKLCWWKVVGTIILSLCIIGGVVWGIFSIRGGSQTVVSVVSEDEVAKELSLRKPMVEPWFAAISELYQQSGDENVGVILQLLTKSSAIMAPKNYQGKLASIFLEDSANAEILIAPITEQDTAIHPDLASFYWGKTAAQVGSINDRPVMMLKESKLFSGFWRGVLSFHEGCHGLAKSRGIFDHISDPMQQRATEEFMIYIQEIGVLRTIGKEPYLAALYQMISLVDEKRKKQEGGLAPSDYDRFGLMLEEVFGPAASTEEMASRVSVLWLDANFSLMNHDQGTEEDMINFLRSMYESGAMG